MRPHASHFEITLFHANRAFDISAGGLEATEKLQSMILQIVTLRFHQVSLERNKSHIFDSSNDLSKLTADLVVFGFGHGNHPGKADPIPLPCIRMERGTFICAASSGANDCA